MTTVKRSEITNVTKMAHLDHSGPTVLRSEVIAEVGNDVAGWTMKREDAVYRIAHKEEEFFTIHPTTHKEIPVEIYRKEYLRSERDDTKTDNLDELLPCSRSSTLLTFIR
jgi:hypothetical protein